MKMLPVAVIVSAFTFGNYVLAQDKPTPKPTYTSEAMLKRISEGSETRPKPPYTSDAMLRRISDGSTMTCVLPDKTTRVVNTTVTVDGKTYRCVEVLDNNLRPNGVAWTLVLPQP